MRVFARVVPTVTGLKAMSVPSGSVRLISGEPDRGKIDNGAALRRSVRFVRMIFYCLTYAHAREAIFCNSQGCFIYSLGISFLSGQAGQEIKVIGIA